MARLSTTLLPTLCGFILAAAPAGGEPADGATPTAEATCDDDAFCIFSDGIMMANVSGQEVLYSGRSEFRWGKLEIIVEGQFHIFWGVSLKRAHRGVDARAELQSMTANGTVDISWTDDSGKRQSLRAKRLVIAPGRAEEGAAGLVTIAPVADGPEKNPSPATLRWMPRTRCWTKFKAAVRK
jgi:hypothetical protein